MMPYPSHCKILMFGFILAGLTLAAPVRGQGRPQLVKDLKPGTQDGIAWDHCRMVSNGIFVFFKADDGVHGEQLWRSDGTERGTIMLTAQPSDGQGAPHETVVDGLGRVFFRHGDPTHGNELWVSDGTPEGTHICFDMYRGPQSGVQPHMMAMGDKVVFSGTSPTQTGIWISDGTAMGTHLLKNHLNGPDALTSVTLVTVNDGAIYYAGMGITQGEMWKSDGTPSGTKRYAKLAFNYPLICPQMAFLGSTAYFLQNLARNTMLPFYVNETSGTAAFINDEFNVISNHRSLSYIDIPAPIVFHNKVFFATFFYPYLDNAWIYSDQGDGTFSFSYQLPTDSTARLAWSMPLAMINAGDQMLLWTQNFHETGFGKTPGGLWSYNDELQEAHLLKMLHLFIEFGSYPVGVKLEGDPYGRMADPMVVEVPGQKRWIFGARDDESNAGFEVWQTDGTAAGTCQLADLNPGAGSSYPRNMTVCNDKLFLSATDAAHGRELWVVPIPAQANAVRGWERFR